MPTAVIGLDIGTSAMKAVVYTPGGAELFAAERAYRLATPQAGWAELDAEELWRTLLGLLRTVADATAERCRIVSLAMAAQAGSTLAVDADGTPLTPMITWLDQRAAPIVAAWEAAGTAARIRTLSGWHPQPGLTIAPLAWLAHQQPEVVRRARYFVGAHDYLVHRLTGRPVTDYSEGAEMLLLEQATRTWSEELCALAGIHSAQLAALAPAGTRVGPLLPAVAAASGLPADLTVAVGGQDQCCAALGMGVTAAGQVMLASGTAWVITALTGQADVAQLPAQVDLNFHVVPGVHTVSQLLGAFGAALAWWQTEVCPPQTEAGTGTRAGRYGELDRLLADSEPGAHGLLFLPLGGSSQVPGHRTRGGFVGLRLDHTRADLARAMLEGAAYEVRWALEALAEHGLASGALWVSGGATHSPHWPQIIADVTGVPLRLAPGANWPARGAALLAAAGAGLVSEAGTAVGDWALPMTVVEPGPGMHTWYASQYAAYRQATVALAAG